MEEPRPIFMTGGWDSIFRLLQLLLIEKRAVQPYYIVDPERWSLTHELKAMSKVKRAIRDRFPEAAERLLPTIMHDRTDVRFDPELKAAETVIRKRVSLAPQYIWLTGAAKQFGIKDAELCVEVSSGPTTGCVSTMQHLYVDGADGIKRLADRPEDPAHVMFSPFSYAITHLHKTDMMNIAREHDFLDILELSWFCHRPTIFGACGTCNPCKDVMTKGLAHRVPLSGQLRFHLTTALDPRPLLRRWPALFNILKRMKNAVIIDNRG